MARNKPEETRFVRQMVLRKPDVTLEEIQEAWDKAGHTKSKRPGPQQLYQARTVLRKKYGVDDLNEIPRKPNGELNVSGIIRIMRQKHPEMSEKQCRNYLKADDITFSPALWLTVIRGEETNPNPVPAENEMSPDPNQDSGPRARVKGKRGRKRKETTALVPAELIDGRSESAFRRPGASRFTQLQSAVGNELLDMENRLDTMIEAAKEAGDSGMVHDLKDARRRICRGILNLLD